MRADAVDARAVIDPEVYEQRTQLAREIADVLRRNVVQAVKVSEPVVEGEGRDKWSKGAFG